jgi:hypothetical protein
VGTTQEIAGDLATRIPALKSGSLSVFGDIFGGRIDNIHVIVGVQAVDEDCLVLYFDGGETLRVWNPEEVTASAVEFKIRDATQVRWEWFYYGREQSPENRYFIEHARVGDDITARTDADWAPRTFSPSSQRPAVELLGL